jgi:hypothetical protein
MNIAYLISMIDAEFAVMDESLSIPIDRHVKIIKK